VRGNIYQVEAAGGPGTIAAALDAFRGHRVSAAGRRGRLCMETPTTCGKTRVSIGMAPGGVCEFAVAPCDACFRRRGAARRASPVVRSVGGGGLKRAGCLPLGVNGLGRFRGVWAASAGRYAVCVSDTLR